VVVDDGSGTAYAGIFDHVASVPGVTLLRHAVHLGEGAAFKTAFNYVLCNLDRQAGVVTVAAGAQNDAEEIERTSTAIGLGRDSVVLGDVCGLPLSLLPRLMRIESNGPDFGRKMLRMARAIYVDGEQAPEVDDSFRGTVFGILAACVFLAALFAEWYGFRTTPLFAQDLWLPVGLTRLERFTGAFLGIAIPILLMFPWAFTGFFAALLAVLTAISVGPRAELAAVFFLLSACALGSKLLRGKDDSIEDHLLATLAGMGIYIFLMAFLARIPVNTVWLWGAILLAPLILDYRHVVARLRYWLIRLRTAELRNVWERAAFALVVFLLVAHWLIALKPETSADGLAIHLAIPMNIAAHHQLTFEPSRFLWAVMPMGADWCFSIVYLFGGEFATHLLVWSLLVLLSCLLFGLLARVSSRAVSWLLVAAFLATPLVQLVTGAVFVENLLAAMVLGLVAALWRFRETGERRFFYLALWLGGTATAVKIGALAFLAPALVFLAIETARRWKTLGRARWAMPALGLVLFAANAAPPYMIAYLKTGNPVFPFRNEKYHSPLLQTGQDIRDFRFRERLRWSTLYDLTFHTHRYYEGQDGSLGFGWLILIPIALAGLAAAPAAAVATGVIALVASIIVLSSEPNARYLYAALPLFLVPSAAVLSRIARRQAVVLRLIAGFLAASIVLGVYFISSSSYYHKDFCLRLPLSRAERVRYIKEAAPVRDIFDYYNRTHAGTPILLTQEGAIAGLRTEIYENHWHQMGTLQQIHSAATARDVLALLKSWNIGYLVAYKPGEGEKVKPATLQKIIEICTTPEYQQGDQYLARFDANCDLGTVPRPPDHPVVLLTRGSYDDLDPAIVLRGNWERNATFKQPLRQTITYTDTPGSEISFAFEGQAVNWIFTRAFNRGIAEVIVDGVSKGTVDLYAPGTAWQSRERFCCYGRGRHEMTIRVTGTQNPKSSGRFVDLDGIFVE
jgi:hypothetical protein